MATRASMNISLPGPVRKWVEQIVATGEYGTASEYFRELVRADQRRRERKRIDALLIDAIESGPVKEMTKSDWARIRREVSERVAQRTRKNAG